MARSDQEEKRLLDFVGDLYDAAADPSRWQPTARKLAQLFDAESSLLLVTDLQNGKNQTLGVTENLDGPFWSGYENHYQQEDLWVAGGIARLGRSVLGQEVAPEGWYRNSAYVNDLCVGADIYHLVGAALPLDENRLGIVGIHRPRRRSSFVEVDRNKLEPLLPHFARAIQIALRLSSASLDHQASLDGLERMGTAVVAVNRDGLILYANRLAESVLRQGVGLCAVNRRLRSSDRRSAARLAFLVAGASDMAAGLAVGNAGGGIAIDRGEGRLPLTVLVAPFRPQRDSFGAPQPAALVFIRDPEMPTLSLEVLRDLFGLTSAQSAVASHLADGESLEQIANKLRITLHTARDHLKQIFSKTGTSRQPQLVALLLRTVAALTGR